MDEEKTIKSICEEALDEIEECWRLGITLSPCHWKKYFVDIRELAAGDGDDRK
jgi:hypothetical protein